MESENLIPTPTKEKTINSSHSSSSTLSLKRTLQKHIKSLLNGLPSLEAAEKDGEKHVTALANLMEQRECVCRVQETSIPLISNFHDLKPRLMLKLSVEVEKEIEFLTNLLIPLKGVKQAMYQVRADVLSLASLPNAQDIDPVTLYEGSAVIPSLAMMMDLLEVVEKESRELYCSRMYYLESILDTSIVTSDNICDLWKDDASKVFRAIKDCQDVVRYFMEEKL